MIGEAIDKMVGMVSPVAGLKRSHARRVLRSYEGARPNRLTASRTPTNQSADNELLGPFGADNMRAWARMLVRDNAYAWGVVDTIVSSVVGNGIKTQSMLEDDAGNDRTDENEQRDSVWQDWCEVCDVNGQLNFDEIQALAQREIVEAGECLVHYVNTPGKTHRGITRPVPLAIELIEADRLASDRDNYTFRKIGGKNRVVRGIEIDDLGKPVAYWIYPEHPTAPGVLRQEPRRIPARNIRHLFRQDRIGQSRGISWFAPVLTWIRDLGFYVDNELQASAVASCFTVAIKSDGTLETEGLLNPDLDDDVDERSNRYEHLEPGMIMHLGPNESIDSANPGRPNSAAEPWINLMLRGISVGTGLSFETVARDYSKTNYSANRASQLEDRRRFRRWQGYLCNNLCQPTWDRFTEAAAIAGVDGFPTMTELLQARRKAAPVKHLPQGWEWVDPTKEQASSAAAIDAMQSTYQDETAAKGKNWRTVLRQRAKEVQLMKDLGLQPNLSGGTPAAEKPDAKPDEPDVDDDEAEEEETEDELEAIDG